MTGTKASTEPQRRPRQVRVVNAIGALAWRERCLSNPKLAAVRGWDPRKPPDTVEDGLAAIIVGNGDLPPEAA
jgi:hypothetical protein